MNKHIKNLIQAFNPHVLQDDTPKSKLPQKIVDKALSTKFPKNKQELINIIRERIEEEKKDKSKQIYKPYLLDIDTSEIDDMSWLFDDCLKSIKKPIILDLRTWDTSNVITMRSMFQKCKSLIDVNLSSFNTSQVTRMDLMFSECTHLKSIDLSSFNTRSVVCMQSMFQNCESLTSIDISHFKLDDLSIATYMFNNCYNLVECKIPDFSKLDIYYLYNMFNCCPDSIIPEWYKEKMKQITQ